MQFPDSRLYGRIETKRRLAGLTLAETSYEPAAHVPEHCHGVPLLCLVVQGGLIERTGGAARRLETGMVVYHPGGWSHAHSFFPVETRCFTLQFGPAWNARMYRSARAALEAPIDSRGRRANTLGYMLFEEYRLRERASPLVIEGLALAMIADLSRVERAGNGRKAEWLALVEERLRLGFRSPPALTDLAAEVGVHPVHVSRAFRQRYGCSPTTFVLRLRVEAAASALLSSDESLSRIAGRVGFADQSHFSRCFRRVMGTTPGSFRAAGQRGEHEPSSFGRNGTSPACCTAP